ncbi:S-adenosylmethionine decarboxylase proenzyme [bacterium HR40]|nr:S-adenosylmethionine decarboxylase proenzyme [bacterium HR40]
MAYSLARIGMEAEAEVLGTRAEVSEAAFIAEGGLPEADTRKDFFVERNGLRFAGTHLILDLWDAERLDDLAHIERTLRQCVAAARATLLHIHLHAFTPNGGVSGVAVLAESHISVHTWPERGYAAFDVFMCGAADPHATIPVLKQAFRPGRLTVTEQLRGIF